MYALISHFGAHSVANVALKEHPVLRQLNELPQIPDQTSSEFSLLDTKGSQVTLDEVRLSSGNLQA